MSANRYQLIKLEKSNFSIWYFQIKNVFEAESIDYVLTVENQSSIYPNWKVDQAKARTILFQSLETNDISLILDKSTAYSIIKLFRERSRRGASATNLHEELALLKWTKNDTADDFVAKLLNIKLRMTEAGLAVDDSRLTHKLVSSLPSLLSDLQNEYERKDAEGESLDFEKVKMTVLRLYETKIRKAAARPALSVGRQSGNIRKFCRYCKHVGHLIEDCRLLKEKEARKALIRSSSVQNNNSASIQHDSQPNAGHRNTGGQQRRDQTHLQPANNQPQRNAAELQLPPQFRNPSQPALCMNPIKREDWEFDSDCAFFMTPHRHHFEHLNADERESFVTGNGVVQSEGIGSVRVSAFDGVQWNELFLNDVHYVPSLPCALFSEPACKPKIVSDPQRGELNLYFGDRLLFTGTRDPNSSNIPYIMNIRVISSSRQCSVVKVSKQILHGRFGHCPEPTFNSTINNELVTGVAVEDSAVVLERCVTCLESKMERKSNTGSLTKTNIAGHSTHSDSYSPKINTLTGLNTAFVFVDEATRLINIQLVKDKSFACSALNRFLTFQKNSIGKYPAFFHSDSGTEFTSSAFVNILETQHIKPSNSTPYVKQQNGLAERTIKHLIYTTNAILNSSGLPISLWNELFQAAAHLINIRFKRTLDSSPFVLFHGYPPPVDHLRILGTYAYVHIPLQLQSTFGSKSRKMRLVNFTESPSIMRFWQPGTRSVKSFHTFTFLPESLVRLGNRRSSVASDSNHPSDHPANRPSNEERVEVEVQHSEVPLVLEPDDHSDHPDQLPFDPPGDDESDHNPPVQPTTSTAPQKRPRKVYEKVFRQTRSVTSATGQLPEQQILRCLTVNPQSPAISELIRAAEQCEIDSLISNGTFEIAHPPPGTKIIQSQFIYGTKMKPITGEIIYKARCVAKGFQQRFGLDYLDTYAPTVSIVGFKIVLVLAIELGLSLYQFDVTAAFLNTPLKEVIWMEPPFSDGTGRKWRLLKSIYGLKQAAADWHHQFSSILTEFGFKVVHADRSLFVFSDGPEFAIICLWVDDGLIAARQQHTIDRIVTFLQSKLTLTSGPANKFIGIEINILTNQIEIHQSAYISKLATHFEILTTRHSLNSPLPKGYTVNLSEPANSEICSLYRSLVSSLLYLSRHTRPDIAFAVGILTTKLNSPSLNDLAIAKRVLQYVLDTKTMRMVLRSSDHLTLDGFCDANYGVEPRGLSRTGCIIKLFGNPIAWFSRLQSVPAKSTAEAEWYAIDACAREMLWIRQLLIDLFITVPSFRIFSDNLTAIQICNDFERSPNARTKHVERAFYFIQHYISKRIIQLFYIPTHLQPADILTKAYARPQHFKQIQELNLEI